MATIHEGKGTTAETRPADPPVTLTGTRQPVLSARPGSGSSTWPLIEANAPVAPAADTPATTPATPDQAGAITEFDGAKFLPSENAPPTRGWRRTVWRASRGVVKPAPGRAEMHQREQVRRIQARVNSCQRIAVASAKGGVGKTTATLLCGTALAMHRLDRIIAVDANPDAGSLGWRVDRETEATLSDLLRHAARIERYSDVRALTSQATSRLEVLASELDPAVSQALGQGDYARVIAVLEKFYSVILCDLGTGLLDSATQGILGMANELVIVASPSVDAGRVASFTLDFIERRHPEKARDAILLINNVRKDGHVDVDALEKHFAKRVRAVIRVPYDPHLANGGAPRWELLHKDTRAAYTEAAAALAEGFSNSPR